jgi:hypothetical protein
MCQHDFRFQHQYSSQKINLVTDEHKALIQAYRHEPVLKQDIDAFTKKSSFVEG